MKGYFLRVLQLVECSRAVPNCPESGYDRDIASSHRSKENGLFY